MDYFFDNDDLTLIQEILKEYIMESGVHCAVLVDRDGNVLASFNATDHNHDTQSLASLAAGNFAALNVMAGMLGENEFSLVFHKGKKENIQLSTFMNDFLLIATFGHDVSLGFLRLKIETAQSKLRRLLAAVKVYVNNNNEVSLICPSCGELKTVRVSKHVTHSKLVKVTCTCKNIYTIQLEYRNSRRKNTNLIGTYQKNDQSGEDGRIIVENLSHTGIGFITSRNHSIKKDDIITVEFTLDDEATTRVTEDVTVIKVDDRYIGGSFSKPDKRYCL